MYHGYAGLKEAGQVAVSKDISGTVMLTTVKPQRVEPETKVEVALPEVKELLTSLDAAIAQHKANIENETRLIVDAEAMRADIEKLA